MAYHPPTSAGLSLPLWPRRMATSRLIRLGSVLSPGRCFRIKKLTRGISRATDNVNLVSRARSNIESNVCNVNQFFIETPVSTLHPT
ncbi:unnamed protein product [Timema podura]|uniref:Uncharacterized protein n=1 Tax=Timema podura TaxID=61482 RepID=A0ABN7P4L9_TIMPD|nr:unnamed protein product [Timema podura]